MTGKYRIASVVVCAVFIAGTCACDIKKKNASKQEEAPDGIQLQYLSWLERGKKAEPELLEAVKSPKWRTRTHALLAMGKTGDREMVPVIFDILKKDRHPAVRNCAVTALGDLKAAETVPYLASMLAKGGLEQSKRAAPIVVIEALGKMRDPRAVPVLREVLLSEVDEQRVPACEALVSIGDPSITRFLLSNRKLVQEKKLDFVTARLAGDVPAPGGEDYLIGIMGSGGIQERLAAALSLGKLKSKRGVPSLIRALEDKEVLLQKHAADSLVAIDDASATAPLMALFKNTRESVYMSAAYALAGMTSSGIAPAVFALMEKNPAVNRPAAYVLGRKKHGAAATLVMKRLKDPNQKGQEELAEALGWMGEKSAIPLLIEVAGRKSRNGSAGAIWSLGQLKAREAVPVLLKILDREDPKLTGPVIAALGSIGDSRATDRLIDFFYGSGDRYARAIGAALGKIGGPKVVSFIKDNLDVGDPARTMAAGSALIKLRDPSLVPFAVRALDSKQRSTRRYAMMFLKKNTGKEFSTENEWKEWAQKR